MKNSVTLRSLLFLIGFLLLGGPQLFAYSPPTDTQGPLTIQISDIPDVESLAQPIPVRITLKNGGDKKLSGQVKLTVIDEWKIKSPDTQTFTLAPNESSTLDFQIQGGTGTYAAHYPVHAWAEFTEENGSPQKAHAVEVFLVTNKAVPPPVQPHPPVHSGDYSIVVATETSDQKSARRQKAIDLAHEALSGKTSAWSWKLESEAGVSGTSLVPGPQGLMNAFLCFADSRGVVVFDGFGIEIDSHPMGDETAIIQKVEPNFDAGEGVIQYQIAGEKSFHVQTRIWSEKGALRVAFSMPDAKRDLRGSPRFTKLAIGPSSEKAVRVYAGFGSVLQDPGTFDIPGGSKLTTRHIGIDFPGLSLVQAVDIYPDLFSVNSTIPRYALVTHGDATFSFIPSTAGAFAAARVYRPIANFSPASGVDHLKGKMCLDQWGGDYAKATEGIEKAASYGITDAIFVKHDWQRWGYDYRLPEIFPPHGSLDDFLKMAAACKKTGILFCPHDNYIDFYPDAEGFTYRDICFRADGTPQRAWLNRGRLAQSYRWLPTAFFPALEKNLRTEKESFSPDGYFLDVFSSIIPFDYYDQQGRFFTKTVMLENWGKAFDKIHEALGKEAPTISETGHDALIGHLDGGEADQPLYTSAKTDSHASKDWQIPVGDSERVPWHDMATHGDFVLLAGGLGHRYANGGEPFLHDYASDDYLCTTVMGGRNPMCEGPFSSQAVMTYWLLHGICSQLARSDLLSFDFFENDIHRQTIGFSDNRTVQINRGEKDWKIGETILPQYGFIAKGTDCEANILRRDGVISAFAQEKGLLFADARPPKNQITPHVKSVEDLGGGKFKLTIEWNFARPLPAGYRPFLHFVDEKAASEGILFQGSLIFTPADLSAPGKYQSVAEVTLPHDLKISVIAIRFGLYHPTEGGRLPLQGLVDQTGRARGGKILVQNVSGKQTLQWTPENPDPDEAARSARINQSRKLVDFGPVATNGAFQLKHEGKVWTLIPLPDSDSFDVQIRLDQLNASGQSVHSIEEIAMNGKSVRDVPFHQSASLISFQTGISSFGYRISF